MMVKSNLLLSPQATTYLVVEFCPDSRFTAVKSNDGTCESEQIAGKTSIIESMFEGYSAEWASVTLVMHRMDR